MAAPVVVQANVGSGQPGPVNVALRTPPTAGNLLVLIARQRGSAPASSAGEWNSSTDYTQGSVVSIGGALYQSWNSLQFDKCEEAERINEGYVPPSYLLPTLCFAAAWWANHPVVNGVLGAGAAPPDYDEWTLVQPGLGIAIWTKTSNGSDGGAVVGFGYFQYDIDVYMFELSNASLFDIVPGSGTSSSVSASGDGFSVTVPLFASFNWNSYLIVFQSLTTTDKTALLLITPVSVTSWITPYPGNPPSGWAAIFGTCSEVLSSAGLSPALPTSDIVTDICLRAGLSSSQIDVSLLTNANVFGGSTQVLGYLVERPTAAAEILKPLMQGYFFDGCETNGTMKWVPRGLSSALTIPESDLGLLSDGAKVKPEQIAQEQDLPLAFTVLYNDIALDYQQGSQQRTRSSRVKKTKQQTIISLPIVMTATQALQIAETALYLAWLERNSFTFNLGSPKYMQLDPTDVVQFVYEGLTFQIRIVENSLGQGFAVMISGVNEDARNFLSSLSAPLPVSFNPAPTRLVGSSVLFLFDIALLQDTDSNPGGTGFYFAMASAVTNWTGGVLLDSSDNSNFSQEDATSLNATYGYATTTLAAPREPWELDTVNTVTVQPVTGSLAGDTLANVLNGSNALILGNEIIQFVNCIDNGDGTYTLSNLLRGRRGTEWACGTHGANELFVMPSSGAQRVQDPLSVLGQTLYYKGVTVGQDPSTVTSQTLAISGADL
jgi:hypothetical protein